MDHVNATQDLQELTATNVHLDTTTILPVFHVMQLLIAQPTDNVIQLMDHVNVILDSPESTVINVHLATITILPVYHAMQPQTAHHTDNAIM